MFPLADEKHRDRPPVRFTANQRGRALRLPRELDVLDRESSATVGGAGTHSGKLLCVTVGLVCQLLVRQWGHAELRRVVRPNLGKRFRGKVLSQEAPRIAGAARGQLAGRRCPFLKKL